MSLLIAQLDEAELRRISWEKIEALEHWLRRLVDDVLSAKYGDYFGAIDAKGNRIVKSAIAKDALARKQREPARYSRLVDALLLDDVIDIVCNPQLFKDNFRKPLQHAFPEGRDEARTFLKRVASPRNNLAHANPISLRQAEQVICYTNDIIDSLKAHYREVGMQDSYDAPLILRVTDSFGNSFSRSQLGPCHDGGIMKAFLDWPEMHLRPGDLLTVEIEVDPSYDSSSYSILWASTKPWYAEPQTGTKVLIPISNRQVGQQFDVQCRITANREWHRMSMGVEDFLMLYYKVLPPVA